MATKKSEVENIPSNFKAEFDSVLLKTEREGIDDLLTYLQEEGFYTAPCSGSYHLAKPEGLLEHSINVLHVAEKLSVALYGAKNLTREIKTSIQICALLHDIGKIGQFGKANYVPNILKSGEQSTAKPYETNKELLYVDHEIRSIAIASMFIDLTEDEQFAILYHNGMYGNLRYALKDKETPLYLIMHTADMWASRILEN